MSRDLKDHMECKSTEKQLLRLKLMEVYFLELITVVKSSVCVLLYSATR